MDRKTDKARPPILRHVAANLKRARELAGLSQEALANLAGVSRRMITLIENGESNASLVTLEALARSLDMAFADLVRPGGSSATKAQPVELWRGREGDSRALLLETIVGPGSVELWQWSLAPGEHYIAQPDPIGTHEILYCIVGIVQVEVDGEERRLGPGQTFSFSSHQPYGYRNPGEAVAVFVKNVVTPPPQAPIAG